MSKEEFTAIMPYISADLVGLIARKNNISEEDAVLKLYNQSCMRLLKMRAQKFGITAPDMLYSLFEQEEQTGNIAFPDV